MGQCRLCGVELTKENQWKSFTKKGSRVCKKCSNEMNKRWKRTHPKETKSIRLKYMYGITMEEFELLRLLQHNRCKICGQPFNGMPFVDHNHRTEKVRGLLCDKCNRLLGYADENLTILQNAIQYLQQGESI